MLASGITVTNRVGDNLYNRTKRTMGGARKNHAEDPDSALGDHKHIDVPDLMLVPTLAAINLDVVLSVLEHDTHLKKYCHMKMEAQSQTWASGYRTCYYYD